MARSIWIEALRYARARGRGDTCPKDNRTSDLKACHDQILISTSLIPQHVRGLIYRRAHFTHVHRSCPRFSLLLQGNHGTFHLTIGRYIYATDELTGAHNSLRFGSGLRRENERGQMINCSHHFIRQRSSRIHGQNQIAWVKGKLV